METILRMITGRKRSDRGYIAGLEELAGIGTGSRTRRRCRGGCGRLIRIEADGWCYCTRCPCEFRAGRR